MGCIRVVAGLFGLAITYSILRFINPGLAVAFVLVLAVVGFRSWHSARREQMRAIRARQELEERLERAAQERADARQRERDEVVKREAEKFAAHLRRGVEAAAAAKAAAEAAAEVRRQQAAERAHAQEGPKDMDVRWRSTDPHVILDIHPEADAARVRSAYTTLARQYHPDKVAQLAPEFHQLAEERMKAINSAYSRLRRNS